MNPLLWVGLLCVIAAIIAISIIYGVKGVVTITPLPTITPIITPIGPIATSQQGPVLVPTDASASAFVGSSVDINSNGNTLVTGGYGNSPNGAAWVYVRSNTTWFQQGLKLVGTGAIGGNQGVSVAIASIEGNTIVSGSPGDNSVLGATWVFTRSNGAWNQQAELIGSDYSGSFIDQGSSVSLSSDGNTALIGGRGDNNNLGATWVFIRSSNTWSQQGLKLVGSGYTGGTIQQGSSVDLSSDGNTALIGGPRDNGNIGATWVFVRTNTSWNQQGSKLIGLGYSGGSQQGGSVSLSGDGNTALLGGSNDNNNQGAVWVFVRSGLTWTQQGNKLTGSDSIQGDLFGDAVSLNQDGNVAVIGAQNAHFGNGQFYVFVRSLGNWSQQGSARVVSGLALTSASVGSSVAISADSTTTVVGAFQANSGVGAIAVFV